MKVSPILTVFAALIAFCLPACQKSVAEQPHEAHPEHAGQPHDQHKIVVTTPLAKDVLITQQYVGQIRSQRHIEVRALAEGYLEPITIKEGQTVKTGEPLFQVVPALYKARLDAELAEVKLAQLEYDNTKRLYDQKVVSYQEVLLYHAKLTKAQAKAAQAETELNFTVVKAPFDGIVDRLPQQQGSLVKKEDLLTTLSDNSVVWVYFNVPEARYYGYKARQGKSKENARIELADARIELVLADGTTFEHDAGNSVTVEGKFNNETGNIPFRADFPNPDRLLRHGQTGNVLIRQTLKNALVIPQRATFEILDKKYVYVIGKDHVVKQREIVIQHELDDIFVVKSGIDANDQIVLEGVRQVRDGEKREYETRAASEVLADQKHAAE